MSVVLKNRATKEYTAFWQQIHVPAVEPGTPFLGEIVLGYGKGIARTRQGGHLTYQLGAEEIYPVTVAAFQSSANMQVLVQALAWSLTEPLPTFVSLRKRSKVHPNTT